MRRRKQFIAAFNQHAVNRAMLAVFVICLLAIFLTGSDIKISDFNELLGISDWVLLGMGLFLQMLFMLFRALAIRTSLGVVMEDVNFQEVFALVFRKSFFNFLVIDSGFSRLTGSAKIIGKKDLSRAKIHAASDLFSLADSFALLIGCSASIAYLCYALLPSQGIVIGLSLFLLFIGISYFLYDNFSKEKRIYALCLRWYSALPFFRLGFLKKEMNGKQFIQLIFIQFAGYFLQAGLIPLCLIALDAPALIVPSIATSFVARFIASLNPAFNGLGLFELVALVFLNQFIIKEDAARVVLAIFFTRMLTDGIPMFVGVAIMLIKNQRKFLVSSLPALALLGSGSLSIIGWFSVVEHHINTESAWISFLESISLILGSIQIALAIIVMNSRRLTWILASVVSIASLTIDYIEHMNKTMWLISAGLTFILLISFSLFPVQRDPQLGKIHLKRVILGGLAMFFFAILGFLLILPGISSGEALRLSFGAFFFDNSSPAVSSSSFFILRNSIQVMSCVYLIYMASEIAAYNFITLPRIKSRRKKASILLEKNKSTALDYYKISQDKYFFFSHNERSFLAFNTSGEYAFILGSPVCRPGENAGEILSQFSRYCFNNCLKPIFLLVEEEYLQHFEPLGLKRLSVGVEHWAIPSQYHLTKESNETLFNTFERVRHHQFLAKHYEPPIQHDLISRAHQVSQQYYHETERNPSHFIEKPFSENGLKMQWVISLLNHKQRMSAFASLIAQPTIARLDMLQKTKEAPHGTYDYLIHHALELGKEQQWDAISLGFVPKKPVDQAKSFRDLVFLFYYQHAIKALPVKGLHDAPRKFPIESRTRWVVYDNDYELVTQIPYFRKTLRGNQAFN